MNRTPSKQPSPAPSGNSQAQLWGLWNMPSTSAATPVVTRHQAPVWKIWRGSPNKSGFFDQDGESHSVLDSGLNLCNPRTNTTPAATIPIISKKNNHDGCEKSPGIETNSKDAIADATNKAIRMESQGFFIVSSRAAVYLVDCPPNTGHSPETASGPSELPPVFRTPG